jgi:hypothetical protein
MAGQPIKGVNGKTPIFPMGSMQDDELEWAENENFKKKAESHTDYLFHLCD